MLDEIQLVENFADVLNEFLRKDNVDIYVTGSNARLLSKDVITEFRGRGHEIKMYPLSFAEYTSVNKSSLPLALGKLCKIRNFSQSPFGGFIFEESDGNFPSGRN